MRAAWKFCVYHNCPGLKTGLAAMSNFTLWIFKNKSQFKIKPSGFFDYVKMRAWITFLLCDCSLLWLIVLRKYLQQFLFLRKTWSIQSLWKGFLPELNPSKECFTARAVMWPLAVVSIHGSCSWCAQNHNWEFVLVYSFNIKWKF